MLQARSAGEAATAGCTCCRTQPAVHSKAPAQHLIGNSAATTMLSTAACVTPCRPGRDSLCCKDGCSTDLHTLRHLRAGPAWWLGGQGLLSLRVQLGHGAHQCANEASCSRRESLGMVSQGKGMTMLLLPTSVPMKHAAAIDGALLGCAPQLDPAAGHCSDPAACRQSCLPKQKGNADLACIALQVHSSCILPAEGSRSCRYTSAAPCSRLTGRGGLGRAVSAPTTSCSRSWWHQLGHLEAGKAHSCCHCILHQVREGACAVVDADAAICSCCFCMQRCASCETSSSSSAAVCLPLSPGLRGHERHPLLRHTGMLECGVLNVAAMGVGVNHWTPHRHLDIAVA